jgi:adenosylcobyric acid synthase
MSAGKTVRTCAGSFSDSDTSFRGYEIHAGHTTGAFKPWLTFDDGRTDGAVSGDGLVAGCYVHGLFNDGSARRHILASLGAVSDGIDQSARIDRALDDLAAALEAAFDIRTLAALAGISLE